MAIRDFYSDVDLKANQLFNSRLHNITTAARIALGLGLTIADKGYQVYDTDLSSPYYWDGTTWVASFSLPILTAGSVVFSNGLTLAEDNANFFWDDVNNKLGIGTNSPSYSLDVVGVISGSSDALINGLTIGRGNGNFPSNTALGANALVFNSTGVSNVAVGATSMINNTIGQQNTSVGYISLASNTEGSYNTAVGFWAMRDNTLGNFNTSLGISSGRSTTTGSNNITIGYLSGNGITTGSANTIIGRASGLFPSLSNTVIIADGAGSYRFYSPSTGNILFGSTTDSGQKLQVTGTAIISGTTTLSSLSGVGSRMVVADAVGELSTAAIPNGTVTSVGLSMPTAFTVTNSPVTSAGTLTVTGAGLASQYVRGDGQLANFPSTSGGGSSVAYYLNGSVSQGTFGGDVYYQLSKTPIFGAGTNFTRTSGAGNGYIASFISDAGDPSLLSIPAGNWTLEFYFNASSNGGNPRFYGELYKVDSSNVFTLIASESANPEFITNGTNVDQYFTSIAVPQTTLLITDRIAIRVYVIPTTRNITLHTENTTLSEVLTTFSTGLTAINGLTAQVQFLATGTSGTDFAINSTAATHTFNLPTASATNRGALSSADWSTFNNKQNAVSLTTTGTSGAATFNQSTGALNIPNYASSGSAYTVTSVSTTYTETATSGTKIIKGNTTGGAFSITLPTAVGNTATIIIKKTAGTPSLTLDGAGTETIDDGLTAVINIVYESITLVSDNANWLIV